VERSLVGAEDFAVSKGLKLLRQSFHNQIPSHLLNRWSSQLTASNIVFVLVHKFPFMPCFDIFNLLYSHLTPRPNHKCRSTLLKSCLAPSESGAACVLRPPGFQNAFLSVRRSSWKCFKYSMKRRAAAKWRLHETDKTVSATRDSLFAQLIKSWITGITGF